MFSSIFHHTPITLVFSRENRDWHLQLGMILNRLLGNGWSDLDDFFGRPHDISIPMKC